MISIVLIQLLKLHPEFENETSRPVIKLTFWDDSTGITSQTILPVGQF